MRSSLDFNICNNLHNCRYIIVFYGIGNWFYFVFLSDSNCTPNRSDNFTKILIKLRLKLKILIWLHCTRLALSCGLLWMFIGIYKSNTQTDVANYSYNFFFGAIFIAYSIWYFLKYRYGCIITENYVYIAEDACFKKLKKEDIEISQVDGLLKVEILKNKKTYVFLAKK